MLSLSPDGAFWAFFCDRAVGIYSTANASVTASFSVPFSTADAVVWTADSMRILVLSRALDSVRVFSLHDRAWNSTIDDPQRGIAAIQCSPCGRHVLCYSAASGHCTVWDLDAICAKQLIHLKAPGLLALFDLVKHFQRTSCAQTH